MPITHQQCGKLWPRPAIGRRQHDDATRHDAAVSVRASLWCADDLFLANLIREVQRCGLTAPVGLPSPRTGLAALRRVYPPEADALAVDLKGVAINDCCPADDGRGIRR